MRIVSADGKRSIDIGGDDLWKAVYSTLVSCIGDKQSEYSLVFAFFETGKCSEKIGYKVARQMNLIRDELSQFSPDKAVYDIDHPDLKAPWEGRLSPVITSCANFFTTVDGKDLLYEVVSILCYAQTAKTSIKTE